MGGPCKGEECAGLHPLEHAQDRPHGRRASKSSTPLREVSCKSTLADALHLRGVFDWAPFRSTKAAIKLHTLLDLRGSIPAFIHISDGKLHDVNMVDILPVKAGAFYVMDRGYVDFERLYAMHQAGAFFVTRAKANMDARRVYSAPADRASGVICDQRIMFNGFYSAKNYPEHLRRIRRVNFPPTISNRSTCDWGKWPD